MQQLYNFSFLNNRDTKSLKKILLTLFFISFCNINYSQVFDLTAESTTFDNVNSSVSEEISGTIMTVTTVNSGNNNTATATVSSFGTNQVAFHASSSINSEEMIISFNTAVNVNTIRVISTVTNSRTWTFTPTGGTNTPIDFPHMRTCGHHIDDYISINIFNYPLHFVKLLVHENQIHDKSSSGIHLG